MTGKLGIIDLFSGCGGSALGFQQAGFPIKVAVDIDNNASESFKINFPNCKVFSSDISYISGKELLDAGGFRNGNEAILIACPPCQGFSSARRNSQRLSDPRNKLIYEFLRVVEEIRPLAFVLENVPGLATGIGKPLFIQILQKLSELGYQTIYDVVNTADYGVPQRRKRLVLLGTNNAKIRLTFPCKTNADPGTASDLPPWKSVREAIADLPKINAGEKSPTDPIHCSASLADINLQRLRFTPWDGGDRTSWPEDLVLECHKNADGHKDVYGRMRWDYPSPTMTGGCGMISKGRFGHPEQNRAISLREAARLQTFPDEFKFIGNFGEIARQIGNAVPPLLAKRAAESLQYSIDELEVSEKMHPNFYQEYPYSQENV
ncbi:DNA cytosine methyltransferase [Candidatus Roizmanbacteria bacterium]|nr:DNA cytosine methyltransferase [Candidatus Roizmanbacteria bacterium]